MENIGHDTKESLLTYEKARSLFTRKNPLGAMVELRKCLSADPNFLEGRFLKARVHRTLGQFEEALLLLEGCLEDASQDSEIQREIAEVALLCGNEKEALKWYETLYRLDPTDDDCCARLAALAFHQVGPRGALKRIEQCLKKNPEWMGGYLYAAHAHYLLGKSSKAADFYRKVLDRVPEHRGAVENLRHINKEEPPRYGLIDQAYEEIFLAEAVRLTNEGLASRSIRLLERWKPRFEDNPAYLEILARTNLELGQTRRARLLLESIPPELGSEGLPNLHARVLMASGDTEEAIRILHRRSEEHPDSPENWSQLAEAHLKRDDRGPAVEALEKGLKLAPQSADLLFLRAQLFKKEGSPERCLEVLEKLLDSDPGHEGGRYALGVECLLAEKTEEALSHLLQAIELNPERVACWRHLAIAYTRLGRWTEALSAWGEVLRFLPDDEQAAGNLKKIERLVYDRSTPHDHSL